MPQGYPAFPKDADWSECYAYIKNMPDKELDELFGIDSNAEAMVQRHQAQQLLQSVICLQPEFSDFHQTEPGRAAKPSEAQALKRPVDPESKDEVVLKMATHILKKLPEQVESSQGQGKMVCLQDVLAEISSEAKEKGICVVLGSLKS